MAWLVITFGGALLLVPAGTSLDDVVSHGIAWQIVLAGVLLVGLIVWRGWSDLGFQPPEPGTLRLLWLPVLIVVLQFAVAAGLGLPSASVILFVVVNSLFVAFSEETMFRGALYRALRGQVSIWPAILLTSVLFGLIHILNSLITGAFAPAVLQAVIAGCSGILLMAIFLRTGSL